MEGGKEGRGGGREREREGKQIAPMLKTPTNQGFLARMVYLDYISRVPVQNGVSQA